MSIIWLTLREEWRLSPTGLFGKCKQIENLLRIWSYLLKETGGGILCCVRYYSRRCFGLSRQENSWTSIGVIVAVFAVLHLCLLRSSPQHKSCWSCRQLLYVTQFFLSPLFLYFFNLEFRNLLLSVPFVLSCVLFCFLSCPSFYSFILFFLFPVFCFLPLFIHFISWSPLFSFPICYFSFLFSYYSILSASPLCFFLFNLLSFY